MNESKSSRRDNPQKAVTRQSMRVLTREDILEKLKLLSAQESPRPKMGAMCYMPAPRAGREEYVCPRCGEITLYANKSAIFDAWKLDACRREFNILKIVSDLSLSLDESSYCSHCSPDARTHQVVLVIKYPDGSSHSCAPISDDDLRMVRSFLKGKLSYKTDNDAEESVKESLPRLKELLGIETGETAVGK